jgi:hypothetical protein
MVSLVVEDDGPCLPEGEATKDAAAAALSHAVGWMRLRRAQASASRSSPISPPCAADV